MYQVLYRKYRPKTFDEVIGQPGVTRTLRAQVDTGRVGQAYLFTGTRGTGKTSCAKLLARAVNCLHPKDGNPCNECAACRSILEGRAEDVQEIDAASNTGVDNVRLIRDEAIYTPVELRHRVYIIDEVHMLSNSAFNALLKIVEEPPEHLIFIFATTELNKVPATILSRCQRFTFRRLSQENIAAQLNEIAWKEDINITADAVKLLARLGDGAMRDALSLLDQCIAAADNEELTAQRVYELMGMAGTRDTVALMRAAAEHDTVSALRLFASIYESGKSISSVLSELSGLARDLLLDRVMGGRPSADLLSGVCTDAERAELLPLLSASELSCMIRRIQAAEAEFSTASDPRLAAELCLIQLCQPELRDDNESLSARLGRLEDKIAAGLPMTPIDRGDSVGGSRLPAQTKQPEAPDNDPVVEPKTPIRTAKGDLSREEFWMKLTERLRREMDPRAMGLFLADGNIEWTMKENVLTLYVLDFAYDILGRNVDLIAGKASAVLEQPIHTRIFRRNSMQAARDPELDRICKKAKELDPEGEVIHII